MGESLGLLVLWTTQTTRRWRGASHSCRTTSALAGVVGMMSVAAASVPLQIAITSATWLSAMAHVSLSPSPIRAPAGVEEAKAVCAMCKAEPRQAWRESPKPGRSPEHVQRNRSRLSPLESSGVTDVTITCHRELLETSNVSCQLAGLQAGTAGTPA